MKRHDATFPALLVGFDLETLERDPHPVFALSTRLELVYVNPAYLRFSTQNGGEPGLSTKFPLGAHALDAVSGDLRGFYEERLGRVLETQNPWSHEYECSSAYTFRKYHQSVYPLKNGQGLVLINSLTIEAPMVSRRRPVRPPFEVSYLQATGLLTQCSNCRRTLRNDGSEAWDWVPFWVEEAPIHASHTICPPCNDYYWKSP